MALLFVRRLSVTIASVVVDTIKAATQHISIANKGGNKAFARPTVDFFGVPS